ncbi:MAG: cupin domain-containing protein, partial [Candidatus Puniceispirillales bacterium]
FTPDDGEPINIEAGDVVYFPANSTGVWEIIETTRKSYLTYKS